MYALANAKRSSGSDKEAAVIEKLLEAGAKLDICDENGNCKL